jgi:hypothetical protein
MQYIIVEFCTTCPKTTLCYIANKSNVVYIGVCNWGKVRGLQKVTPSLYGFAKEQDAINAKKLRWWVAPKLFFVYSKLGIANSLQ